MNTILTTTVICAVLGAVILTVAAIDSKRKARKQYPVIYQNTKIFLNKMEMAKFENSTREEKRRAMGHFKSLIKKCRIIPVYEKGEIVGYINNPDK